MLAISMLWTAVTQPAPGGAGPFPLVPIAIFLGLLIALLALDLGVLNRKAHVIRATEAMMWTGFWMTLALLFGGVVYLTYENHWFGLGLSEMHAASGREALVQYITGYLVEQSLSLDNIFVIATIFAYFRVPPQFQHRVLFWGIIGVIFMRGGMIAGGAALITTFDWSVYLFGAILFYSAVKMLALDTENINIEASRVVRLGRRLFPIHSEYEGQRFFLRIDGRLHATPLFLVLLMVETADAVFALDSIPAIFAVTTDPFIVFTSNVFAILGLRSLYFALAAIVHKFRYLKVSLAFLLAYVGVKMVLSHHYEIDPIVSLVVIAAILALGIVASIASDRRARPAPGIERPQPPEGSARMTRRQARTLLIMVLGATGALVGLVMAMGPLPWPVAGLIGAAALAGEAFWGVRLLGRYRRTAQLGHRGEDRIQD